ncbi:hypothetical protein QR685DRAFT_519556 [Neurospora intermedia]|uniref:Uncharacterized protein n=1 Tax=Neurospora intermedia TaxID=5142 RepID=A0ABR3DFY0_NEUIN
MEWRGWQQNRTVSMGKSKYWSLMITGMIRDPCRQAWQKNINQYISTRAADTSLARGRR